MSKSVTKSSSPILAVVLAWLIPGAGHFYVGRKARGAIIFLVIGATFWGGVAMGGALTVDRYNSFLWFCGQMCAGVHGVYGWHRQKVIYDDLFERLGKERGQSKEDTGAQFVRAINASNLGKDDADLAAEVDSELQKAGVALAYMPTENSARAYAGVAGMLNLLCVIDALMLSLMGVYGEPPPPAAAGKEAS